MKAFIYKVLSKGLLILLLSCLVAGYYFRAELFPGWFPGMEGSELTAESAADPQVADEPEVAVAVAVEPAAKDAYPPATDAPVDNTPSQTLESPAFQPAEGSSSGDADSEPQPFFPQQPEIVAVKPAGEVRQEIAPSIPDVAASDAQAVSFAPATDDGRNAFSPMEPAPEGEPRFPPVAEPREAPTELPVEPELSGVDALLTQARDAYWAGNYVIAEQAYQQAIAISHDDPTPHGELGNVYFAQKKWDAAADAYFEAAQRLLSAGRMTEARHLVPVLQGINADYAEKLKQAMPQAAQ